MRLAVHSSAFANESGRDLQVFDSGTLLKLGMQVSPIASPYGAFAGLACFLVLVGWVPLLLLALIQGALTGDAAARSLLSDVAVYARSLIAAPLLVIALQICLPRLTGIALNFRNSGTLATRDFGRFDHACWSSRRLCNFAAVDVAIVALSYIVMFTVFRRVALADLPPWYAAPPGAGFAGYSLIGWYHNLVSVPLLLVLILGWLWRVVVWTRFLYLVSRLDLKLVPAHPDRTAGLKFVGYSVQSFALVALAFGFVVAGSAANQILYRGAEIASLQSQVIELLALVLLLFAAPLLVFFPHLLRAWRQGVFEYGTLAAELGRRFESKWFKREMPIDKSALEVQDFSATTDLYQIAANVYEVRLFPAGLMSLGILAIMAIAPFALIALMFIPADMIIKEAIGLLA